MLAAGLIPLLRPLITSVYCNPLFCFYLQAVLNNLLQESHLAMNLDLELFPFFLSILFTNVQ